MIEVKYHGIRLDNSERVYGFYGKGLINVSGNKEVYRHFIMVWDINGYFSDHEVNPESVGQYTELHDNSDEQTEIYSGHIVSYLFEGETIYCEVKYEAGGYLLASRKFEDSYIWITDLVENDGNFFWTPELQVVGNIYLNSNLLDQE